MKPLTSVSDNLEQDGSSRNESITTIPTVTSSDLEESNSVRQPDNTPYLRLKQFSSLDPTLKKLLVFLNCFGLTVNFVQPRKHAEQAEGRGSRWFTNYLKILTVIVVSALSLDVAIALNLSQSKLLSEQKRAAPLLTFVIVAYSVSTVLIPAICNLFLVYAGSHLFRFYSRTTATVCDGQFFGKRTFVDSWLYYSTLVLIAFIDSASQMIVRGIWPKNVNSLFQMVIGQTDDKSPGLEISSNDPSYHNIKLANYSNGAMRPINEAPDPSVFHYASGDPSTAPKVHTFLLDSLLGPEYAHSDTGIWIKIVCLMVQFIHSDAIFIIIISLANHYATILANINENLDKYESRLLLKQLIILRDSSEQISIMISLPFALVIQLVFTRQIALIGVFIQSTMLPYENWAILLQAFTSGLALFVVFLFCDGLQSASKQTHRLKTEQTVIDDSRGGDQSIYEFLDYLNLLSKSIRITFFNIIAINKNSLVSLYGHILTLTFVTS